MPSFCYEKLGEWGCHKIMKLNLTVEALVILWMV